jgi:uncharacterized protein (DUF1697 family)
MTLCVGLLRGVNVGRARRIAMSELRDLFDQLGYHDVRTLLNSGNVIFRAAGRRTEKMTAAIEAAIAKRFGFDTHVVVLAADDLAAIAAENTLAKARRDPSRLLVGFFGSAAALTNVRPLLEASWGRESVAVGSRAVYLWCADGIIESPLMQAFTRATGNSVTTRNWATVLKLQGAVGSPEHKLK